MDSLSTILNAVSLSVLIALLVQSFNIGRRVGAGEESLKTAHEEIAKLRTKSHELANLCTRLSAKDEMRGRP